MIEQMTDCHLCQLWLASGWHLLKEACSSVAIETGRTTEQEMALVVKWYHDNRHQTDVVQKSP